jgi:hypothetical protein
LDEQGIETNHGKVPAQALAPGQPEPELPVPSNGGSSAPISAHSDPGPSVPQPSYQGPLNLAGEQPDPQKPPYLVAHFEGSSKGDNPRENAVILILARNSEREALAETLRQFESMFNGEYNYPYLFLNDALFDSEFIASMREVAPSSNMTFGKVCP